jgi:hypothetical protein
MQRIRIVYRNENTKMKVWYRKMLNELESYIMVMIDELWFIDFGILKLVNIYKKINIYEYL